MAIVPTSTVGNCCNILHRSYCANHNHDTLTPYMSYLILWVFLLTSLIICFEVFYKFTTSTTSIWQYLRGKHLLFYTAQKMKFSIKDFCSKCDKIRSFLRIWSHLLKKSLIENFIFCAVLDMIFSPIFVHICFFIIKPICNKSKYKKKHLFISP